MSEPDEESNEEFIATRKVLLDEQRFVSTGWEAFKFNLMSTKPEGMPDPPPQLLNLLEAAFYAGSEHMFEGTVIVIGQSDDASELNTARLDGLNDELELHHIQHCPVCAAKGAVTKH